MKRGARDRRALRTGARSRTRPAGPRPAVALLAPLPARGLAKPGLAPLLRADETADLARALLLDAVQTIERIDLELAVAFTPSNARSSFERLVGRHRRLVPQGTGDGGERLARVLTILFERHRRPVLALAADGFGVTRERIGRASEALGRADAVLGPRLDGGLDLVGLRAPRPDLARRIPWGTSGAGSAAADALRDSGLRVETLPAWRPLEGLEDLFEWYAGARAANLAESHPRTWSTLHALLPPRRFAALEEAVREAADA